MNSKEGQGLRPAPETAQRPPEQSSDCAKALWNNSIELFRKHLVLWAPCLIAAIAMLLVGKLKRAEMHWLLSYFSTQHSVLGGDVPAANQAEAIHRTMAIVFPLSFLLQFFEVCLFVVALATTKNLVQVISEQQRPHMMAAVRQIAPRWRELLLFSLKYMAGLAVITGVLVVLSTSPLTPERFHQIFLSKVVALVFAVIGEGCLAWLLMPAALRLLRPPNNPGISTHERTVGVVFAVATSAASLVLERLISYAEASVIVDSQWGADAVALMNTVITTVPEVLLFIALALIAVQRLEKVPMLSTEPELDEQTRLI